jgi:TonB family protein
VVAAEQPDVRLVAGVAVRRGGTVCVLACLLALLVAPPARADGDAGADGPPAPDDAAAPFVSPAPLEMPPIAVPPGVTLAEAVEVQVILTIDVEGAVTGVETTRSGGEVLDQAVQEGVRRFRFRPASQGGKPLPVRIPFTQRFLPPPPPAVARAPELDALIEGMVVTRGARTPVVGATVAAIDEGGPPSTVTTDERGMFVLPVRSERDLQIRITAAEHDKFLQRERVGRNEQLRVKYLIDRKSYGQYEAVVRAETERTEVSRTTLSGREITHVPGTFGDPFRVINYLPGVTTVMGLLPLPIVRGSSPGNTGVLLDGIRLPLLFHLFAGPSVVHPEFIDRVDFYPGGFPVSYGGYTGGIVDGVTRPAGRDERRIDLDLTLTQTGGLVREPIPALGLTATVAGRIGYPGVILSLLAPDVSLSYWDYQARFDGGSDRNHWSVFFFGASDDLKARANPGDPLRTISRFAFHRLDLRYQHGDGQSNQLVRLVLGYDDSLFGGNPDTQVGGGGLGANSWSAAPQLRLHQALATRLDLDLGAESNIRTVRNPPPPTNLSPQSGQVMRLFNQDGWFSASGVYAQAVWKPWPRLRLIPGVRADLYDERHGSTSVTQSSLDPRLLARLRVGGGESTGGVWLKGVIGRYHQPPRLFVPVPGLDASSLELGLLASTQASLGAEARLTSAAELDVNVYYNAMNPVLFDLAVNPAAGDVQQPQPVVPPWQVTPANGTDNRGLDGLFTRRVGRSYGLEVLLRRRDAERLFGWVSYTLSRSERRSDNQWEPFDFDRLQVLNFVAGVRLPRNWELGGRVLLQSGTPLTTIFGSNISRSDGQFRFDLRIDKRAVWNRWLLDFYVDIINTTVAEESGGLIGGQTIRYLVPTLGFRGVL